MLALAFFTCGPTFKEKNLAQTTVAGTVKISAHRHWQKKVTSQHTLMMSCSILMSCLQYLTRHISPQSIEKWHTVEAGKVNHLTMARMMCI